MKTVNVLLALVAAADAAVIDASSILRSDYAVDTFDSPAQLIAGLTPDLSPVGTTAGGYLAYNTFLYANEAATLATLKPPGSVGVITFGTASMEEFGQPAWYPVNSSVVHFDQSTISYACVVQSQEAIAVPTTCTIQLVGRKTGGNSVVKVLPYNPSLLPIGQQFVEVSFPGTDWDGLVRVDVQVIQAALPVTGVIPVFDNNAYLAYVNR